MAKNGEAGILQKFVEPKGEKDSIYKFQYSKDLRTAEMLASKALLNDKRINVYERCDLLTQNPRFIETKGLTSELIVRNINELLDTITKHIFSTSYQTLLLKSGTFFFKLDVKDKIHF